MIQTYRSIALVTALFVAAQIFADIASLRILSIAGLSIDGGTLVYPFVFTLRDVAHKLAGGALARVLIFSAAGLNLAMAGLFWLVSALPADSAVGSQTAFADALMPVWRIVLASIAAEVIAGLLDTQVYEWWVKRVGARYQWGRVLSSNAISIPVDSAVFVLLAFAGDLPSGVLFSIFTANVLVKGAVALCATPSIYLVRDAYLERSPDGIEW